VGVLLTAPQFRRGIEWLDTNIIGYWTATYRTAQGEIQLLYTDEAIPDTSSWDLSPCRTNLRTRGGRFYHRNSGGWSIVVSPVADHPLDSGLTCQFVDLFVARFQFFLNLQSVLPDGASRSPPFPAIVAPIS